MRPSAASPPSAYQGVPALLIRVASLALALIASCGGGVDDRDDVCSPDDADGVIGGDDVFELTVDDSGFSPSILTAQNNATVHLTVRNAGSKPHDWVIDCMPTPNGNGCPATSCFPESAVVAALAPGAGGTAVFVTPTPEGIHYYHSSIAGDAAEPCGPGALGCGQFIVK